MSTADLAIPLRNALLGVSGITTPLPAYKDSKTIFTRRPVPNDAKYPMIVVSPDISVGDEDGLSDNRPIATRDVTVYGQNEFAEHYRTVETLAYLIRTLFHRQRAAITVAGWHVVDIRARGPMPAPVDDEKTVARVVSLEIRLARLLT